MTIEKVNKVSARNQRRSDRAKQGRNMEHGPEPCPCKFCGGKHSFQKDVCPAWGQRCRKCGGRNHFARKCLKQAQGQGQQQRGSVGQLVEASEESETSDIEFNTICRIPTALKDPFKKELDKLVQGKIIAPVEQPTHWVSSVVVTTIKSGALRICIDPRPLNKVLTK